ncbi:hypothetical protein JW707_02975 [Candidatus Woesearchaeota archaeon]|nr:hypothetical protein [Candidatus Woesearchaeota archaeon]
MKKKKLTVIKRKADKLAAISVTWFVMIIASAIMIGEGDAFIRLLPVLCLGGFAAISIEIYSRKQEE